MYKELFKNHYTDSIPISYLEGKKKSNDKALNNNVKGNTSESTTILLYLNILLRQENTENGKVVVSVSLTNYDVTNLEARHWSGTTVT